MGATSPRLHTAIQATTGASRNEIVAARSTCAIPAAANSAENPGSPNTSPIAMASTRTMTMSAIHHTAATASLATANQ
ncbi:hypothetical protein SRABI128_06457 [Microbacterium sp. Bi128]|nr:hypothetical protein SRABI128_06457 [Microbacterium sp. Bi128]